MKWRDMADTNYTATLSLAVKHIMHWASLGSWTADSLNNVQNRSPQPPPFQAVISEDFNCL